MNEQPGAKDAPDVVFIGDFGAPVVLPAAELASFRKGALLVAMIAVLSAPLVFCH